MKKLAIFILLFLIPISFSPKSYADNQDDVLRCTGVYDRYSTTSPESFSSCIGGSILDNNGNVIPASKNPRVIFQVDYFGTQESDTKVAYPPNNISGNGNDPNLYEYCSVIKVGNSWEAYNRVMPRVTAISFIADGFQESQSYTLNDKNACMTTGGTAVGNSPRLQPINESEFKFGCFRDADGKATGCQSLSLSTGTPASKHKDEASCNTACVDWYYDKVESRCVEGMPDNAKEDEILGPYPTKDACIAGAREENEPTPIPSATPTPLPPLLPCVEYTHYTNPEGTVKPEQCKIVLTAFGNIGVEPGEIVKSIFILILSLSGGIALLLIILSGYKLMTSQGDPEKVKDARDTLTSAIVGLLFIIFSLVILETIGVDILNLPGFSK